MRRTVVVLAICGAACVAAAVARPGVQVRPAPSLALAAGKPLTVVGEHFRPHERLRITARLLDQTGRRTLTAGEAGRFRVVFRQLTASRCDLLRVVAVTASGRDVVLKRLPAPACSLS